MSFSTTTTDGLWKFLVLRRDGNTNSRRDSSYGSLARRDSQSLTEGSSGGGSSGDSSNDSTSSTAAASKKDLSTAAGEVFLEIFVASTASFVVYAMGFGIWNIIKIATKSISGDGELGDVDQMKRGSAKRLTEMMVRRGRKVPKGGITLDAHESHIAEDIIDPDDMDSCFADIGGLDHLKQEIWELAVLPLTRPDLFRGTSKLLAQTSGILLFGRPGCGKTLLAKAIAKESEAIFIPIKLSKILNKWVGESNKLVASTFSLARKLAPAIIFIDELDTFLSSTVDPSASKSMESLKAEFLVEWDGISTNRQHAPVLVLGATNRPQLVDAAILRRMPRSFEVPLPDATGREKILRIFFKDQPMDSEALAFLPRLAKEYTKGYSGSDLKELCKAAAFEAIREIVAEESRRAVMGEKPLKPKKKKKKVEPPKPKFTAFSLYNDPSKVVTGDSQADQETKEVPQVRKVSVKDLCTALKKVKRTGQSAQDYGRSTARQDVAAQQASNPLTSMLENMTEEQAQKIMNQFLAMSQQSSPRLSKESNDDVGDVPPPYPE